MSINIINKGRTHKLFIPNKKIILYSKSTNTYKEVLTILFRFYLQTLRKPSIVLMSLIQPLLWLIMFGGLFQNAPIYLFEEYRIQYKDFLNPGIIIFTAFNSSINSGLNIIFDREFGFLNRVLTSPISNKNSIIYSCTVHTWVIAIAQIVCITLMQQNYKNFGSLSNILAQIITITIVIFNVSQVSICNAFVLPGHIEFIGLTTIFLNLPTLFASTALAPLSFMPNWLQTICCINPLTYAIEIIRHYHLGKNINSNVNILTTTMISINLKQSFSILLFISLISFISVKRIIKYKYDKN
uniref:ABC transmembrane type-2 domain-containing protein n=1 Tax=Polysiphonia sertularioides TaxID=945028 RepID=A0A1Z1MGB2_9FLOR|nr:hypothetical protein [Polysiphonia sertularioides]